MIRTTVPVLLLLAMLFVACGDDDDDGGGDLRAGNPDGFATTVAGDGDAAESADAPSETGAGGGVDNLQSFDRKIILTSDLSLESDAVQSTFSRVSTIARTHGGFVAASDLRFRDVDGEEMAFATITVRVPGGQHESMLAELRALSGTEVVAESTNAREVTEEYTDLESRLRNLERIESQYIALLDRAVSIEDILVVTDRLDGTRAEIEQVQGRLNLLDDLVDLATVTVSISPVAAPVGEEDTSPLTVLDDAWQASVAAATGVLYAAIVVGVFAIWIVPVGLLAWGAGVVFNRASRRWRPAQPSRDTPAA